MKLFKYLILNGLIVCSLSTQLIFSEINDASKAPLFNKQELEEAQKIFNSPEFQNELNTQFQEEYDKMSKMSEEELKNYVDQKMEEAKVILDDPKFKEVFEQLSKPEAQQELKNLFEQQQNLPKPEIKPQEAQPKKEEFPAVDTTKIKSVIENAIRRIAEILKKGQALPRISPELKYEDQWAKLKLAFGKIESYLSTIVKNNKLLVALEKDENSTLKSNIKDLSNQLSKYEPKFTVPDTMQLCKVYSEADKPKEINFAPSQEQLKQNILPLLPVIDEMQIVEDLRSFLQKVAPEELKKIEEPKRESYHPGETQQNQYRRTGGAQGSYQPSSYQPSRNDSYAGSYSPPYYPSPDFSVPAGLRNPEARAKEEKGKEKETGGKPGKDGKMPSAPKEIKPPKDRLNLEKEYAQLESNLKGLSDSLKVTEKLSNLKAEDKVRNKSIAYELEDSYDKYDKAIESAKKFNDSLEKMPQGFKKFYSEKEKKSYSKPELMLDKYYEIMKKAKKSLEPKSVEPKSVSKVTIEEAKKAKESKEKEDPCIASAKIKAEPNKLGTAGSMKSIELTDQLNNVLTKHDCLKNTIENKNSKEKESKGAIAPKPLSSHAKLARRFGR